MLVNWITVFYLKFSFDKSIFYFIKFCNKICKLLSTRFSKSWIAAFIKDLVKPSLINFQDYESAAYVL